MKSDDNYTNILLEDMNSKFTAIMEATAPLPQLQKDVAEVKERLTTVEADVKVIKAAVTDLSHQVHDHETRITRLETA